MEFVNGPIPIGEWLPDVQDVKFPALADARNVEPIGTVYKSFEPLIDTGGVVVPGDYLRGFIHAVYGTDSYVYAASGSGIYESSGGVGVFTSRSSSTAGSVDFIQFDNLIIATLLDIPSSRSPLYLTLGSLSAFATLGSSTGTAPAAVRCGKINQFLFLGNLTASHAVRWSGVDAPLSWPTPNSSTAIAQQSSQQLLDAAFGEVTGFANGDQFGLVFQQSAITRVSYVGPPVVFQFDKISDKVGCSYPRSIVQVGGVTYFISSSGFFKTDGVNLVPIGVNKIDDFFRQSVDSGARDNVWGAHNRYKNLIFWAYPDSSATAGRTNKLIIYNVLTDRFTRADQVLGGILSTTHFKNIAADLNIRAFGASNTLGAFTSGTVLAAARLETGDIEFNPGGRGFLSGAKLIVDQTANAVVAYSKIRDEIVDAQFTTSSASTTNSQTGFADFRRDSRYHRMIFDVSGVFDQAQSMEFKARPSGGR